MSLTIDALFYGAYRDAGLVRLEQTGLNADQTEEGRQVYNRMVDAWTLDGLTVSHVARLLFPITPGKGDYSLGANGDWDPATLGLPGYPVRVERASMVLTTQTPQPEYKIFPLTIDQWQDWTLKTQSTNWPRRYFYEPSFPLAIFHLVYVPTDANAVALYLEEQIPMIAATGDALLSFRPGYEDAITSNLAVRIAARTPGSNISPMIVELARSSLSLIKMANNRPLRRENDMGRVGPRRSDILNGNRYL